MDAWNEATHLQTCKIVDNNLLCCSTKSTSVEVKRTEGSYQTLFVFLNSDHLIRYFNLYEL